MAVTQYEAVIGLEVHAELATQSKMFCACKVVDSVQAPPNVAVCPVCEGLPGALPVVNRMAVEYALRVALALECKVSHTSIFARKNYFYPDLPKGYQISQFEYPLAEHGCLVIKTADGEKSIRIRRVHMEEDAGKLTHVTHADGRSYSLVDLNRAGVPLLEIVSEPDLSSVEEVRAYGEGLRAILRYLGVNSGDMEKGVIRFEANISVRPVGSQLLGTRTEVKNLNSFRAMERAVLYEIDRQVEILKRGGIVDQETLGWDDAGGVTYTMRSKEDAHDYRYFPEPDLPPLIVEQEWIDRVRADIPELPRAKALRFQRELELPERDAWILVDDLQVAEYFEKCVMTSRDLPPKVVANWVTGEIFGWLNQSGKLLSDIKVSPAALAELVSAYNSGKVNQNTAKTVLAEMLESGKDAGKIIEERGLHQVSDANMIAVMIKGVLDGNPKELESYIGGKETLSNWFFGQVMRQAGGKANPQVLRAELQRQLTERMKK